MEIYMTDAVDPTLLFSAYLGLPGEQSGPLIRYLIEPYPFPNSTPTQQNPFLKPFNRFRDALANYMIKSSISRLPWVRPGLTLL